MSAAADVLANPFWHALQGAHAGFALHAEAADGRPAAACYEPDVSPFAAVADPADPAGWRALADLVGPGRAIIVAVPADADPSAWTAAGWAARADLPGIQMVGPGMGAEVAPGLEVLDGADVPEMLELVARTRPGPFEKRTIELGGYLGVRHEGRLVAMAGHRARPPGCTEISAVCTDADQRGRGLGAVLVRATAAPILARGEVPYLHTAADNSTARRLYERLGMTVTREVRFVGLRRSA